MASSFGDTLRRYRLLHGLSQEELAATAGVGVRGLRNIEAGRIAAPRPATVRLLADALGLAGDERDDFVATALIRATAHEIPPVFAQLPRDVAAFTGRADALALLGKGTGSVAVISGAGGVGKTALAVHWAHRAADHFPDGQLYANLHGFGPEGSAVDPGDVLADFLTTLGMDRTAVPPTTAARSAVFRSRLAGRRVLVLLDNARDAEQVRPLLPGAGNCGAVVTSRSRLTGLIATDDAVPVPLDVLVDAEALDLLERRLGADRMAATPDAAAAIVARCDRMPLALAIVAARAVAQADASMVEIAEELRDPAGALTALDVGDAATDLRTVFSWSVQALPAGSRRLFALLGLHPGTDIEAYAAANVAGESLALTRRMLAELVSLHLMSLRPGGRHGMHDLVRAYAAEIAKTELTAAERAGATGRLLTFYRHTAVRAGRLVHPGHRMTLTAGEPATALSLPHHDAAALWIRAERANLLATADEAADHGDLDYAPTINLSLWNHWNDHGFSAECLSISTVAVAAARRGTDRLRLAYALSDMAGSLAAFGRYPETIRYGEESCRLLHDEGDPVGERLLLGNLQELYAMVGDMAQARRCAEEQMAILREAGNRIAEAETAILLSQLNLHLGQLDEALAHARTAVAVFEPTDRARDRGEALAAVGVVHLRRGEHHQARTYLLRAVEVFRSAGMNGSLLARVLAELGRLCCQEGELPAAGRYLTESLEMAREFNDPERIAEALTELGLLRADQGRGEEAAAHVREALELTTAIGARRVETRARHALGMLHAAAGDTSAARREYAAALDLATTGEDAYARTLAQAALTGLDQAEDRHAARTGPPCRG